MTKEQEIIKSFLLGNFYWVDIDSDGGNYSEELLRCEFKGNICSKGMFWDFNMGGKGPLKTWTSENECKEWLPENILHESFKKFSIDKTGKKNDYVQLIKDIDEDTKLLLAFHSGSISGVNYGNGWEVRIGIVYKNIIFRIYQYKTSDLYHTKYQLDGIYDIDYIRSLDFSNMNKLETIYDLYVAEHDAIRKYQQTTNQDMADVLALAMEGDTLVLAKELCFNFHLTGHSSYDHAVFGRETLNLLKPKKIKLQHNFDIKYVFEIPDSLEEIILDFDVREWSEGPIEEFLDQNKELGKYLKCNDECEKVEAREIYNKELEEYRDPVVLKFEYKELSGFVYSNQYQLKALEEYYKDTKMVILDICETEVQIPIKTFWNALTIEKGKKIKNKKYLEKGMSYFGHNVGYTGWFPKECKIMPEYKFQKPRKVSV